MPVTIYALLDPRSDEVRYVGKTKRDVSLRLSQHLSAKVAAPRGKWFDELKNNRLKPKIAILEIVENGEDWAVCERFWIAYYRKQGCSLVNVSIGGHGGTGRPRTEFEKEHLRKINLGRVFTDEHRAKLAEAKLGKPPANKGVPRSEETKAKLRAATKAQWERMTPEERAALNEKRITPTRGQKRKPMSEETKAKVSAAKKGQKYPPRSPDHMKKVWETRRMKAVMGA